jgi:hypothetical protein
LYTGIDLLFLSPKISDQGFSDLFFPCCELPSTAHQDGTLGTELEFAQRVFVGYQGAGGGGVRVRWFTFDSELEYNGEWENGGAPLLLHGGLNIDVDYIDAELTQIGAFQTWTWLGSAGVRYGRAQIEEQDINFEDIPAAVFLDTTGMLFEGAGPTLSVEGARPILWSGFSIFANARTSLLFGDTDVATPFFDGPTATFTVDNDFVQVWEFQIGTRYFCPVSDGVDFFSGVFWEAQRWDSDSGFLGDLAFHGLGTQFGFLY